MPPFLAATSSTSVSHPLLRPKIPKLPFTPHPLLVSYPRTLSTPARAKSKNARNDAVPVPKPKQNPRGQEKVEEELKAVGVEEDVTWIKNKTQRLVKLTGSVSHAIPGPRVGRSPVPWMLAVPLTCIGLTFVDATAKVFRRFSSPDYPRRELVRKNAMVCKYIDELFEKGGDALQFSALEELAKKTGFSMEDILRKYIRYALNEKPFNPELVSRLLQLRKASMLEDSSVSDMLNEISTRIVTNKGRVVMDLSRYSEQGFKRKLAVKALFGKVFYLSEMPEFCSRDNSLIVKEIFGVTDEDVDNLRLHTLAELGDVESLEKMVNGPDSEESDEMVDGYDWEDPDETVDDGYELEGSEEMVDGSDSEEPDQNSSAAP